MIRNAVALLLTAALAPAAFAEQNGSWSIPSGPVGDPPADEVWGSSSAQSITFTVTVDSGQPDVYVRAYDANGGALYSGQGWKATSSASVSRTETAKKVEVVGCAGSGGAGPYSASNGTYTIEVGDEENDARSTWSTTTIRGAVLHDASRATVSFTVEVDAGEAAVTVKVFDGATLLGEWTVTEGSSVSKTLVCTKIEIPHGTDSAGEFNRNVD